MSAVPTLPISTPAEVAIFTAFLTQGPIGRVEVARRLNLSAAAVTKALRPLIEAGYIAEMSDERPGPAMGRPSSLIRVVPDKHFFIGVKVTADELIAVLVDLRAQVRAAHHLPLPVPAPNDVVGSIAVAVSTLLDQHPEVAGKTAALGVSVSGDVDALAGLVRHSPLLGWRNVPLAHLVETVTGIATVVENDVRALTVTESWFGSGVGASSFALITIGAGIGCGLFINGDVITGAHGVSGEIGHLPLSQGKQVCSCGKRGCVEAVASSDAILRQVRQATGDPELTLARAIDLAHHGDRAVARVFDRAGRMIGQAIAAVANLFGPQRIVISGEGVADYDLYGHRIREAFLAHAFGAAADCDITVRPLSFEEWARGAAAIAIRTFINPSESK
jgi:predicted NBD/HSP70 family sugar kinase